MQSVIIEIAGKFFGAAGEGIGGGSNWIAEFHLAAQSPLAYINLTVFGYVLVYFYSQ